MTKHIDSSYFINRELSWLDFNSRVLEEANDETVPLLDRLKFVSIFSNNLDEFFMVRVAGLKQQVDSKLNVMDPAGLTPEQQLKQIRLKVIDLLRKQYSYLLDDIFPALKKKSVILKTYDDLTAMEQKELSKYFDRNIVPVLTPVAVDPSHPFPRLNNGEIEIAVNLSKQDSKKLLKALVEVPAGLPRFIRITGEPESCCYVMLEEVISVNIHKLFSGCEVIDTLMFRITRDMAFAIDEYGASDLLHQIEETLRSRKKREPVRLEIVTGGNKKLMKWLIASLKIAEESIYEIPAPLKVSGFFELVSREASPELHERSWEQFDVPEISDRKPVLESINKQGTIPLFLPFQKFDPIIRFLNEAADDPNVLAIKQTLYRVSGDSPIVDALQRAAENKKQVTVIVELKARFDEEQNISWARKLEESGAHVIYGIAGLKIHCKALLIIRREKGKINRYLHLSTGNYNDKTAKLYTDIGIFSNDSALCSDVASLFNVMTGYAQVMEWDRVAVAPQSLRQKFISLIDREARVSTSHRSGRIIAKMNSLVDPEVIEHLYKAAYAGVKVDLIVRGICCLRPGIKTGNIRIISVIDRLLEHSRIFYFDNGGNPEYYLSSADWMPRNLDHRIELLFPIEDDKTRDVLNKILKIQLNDRIKARILRSDGRYHKRKSGKNKNTRSQQLTYELFKSLKSPEPKTFKDLVIHKKKKRS